MDAGEMKQHTNLISEFRACQSLALLVRFRARVLRGSCPISAKRVCSMFLARCRATYSSSSIIISSSVASRATVTAFSASYTASESSPTVLQKKLSPLLLLRATRPLFADQLLKALHFQCATVFCIAPISLHWRRCDTHIIGPGSLPKNAQTLTRGVAHSPDCGRLTRNTVNSSSSRTRTRSPTFSRFAACVSPAWEPASRLLRISNKPGPPVPRFPSLQCNQRCLSVSKRRLPKIPDRFCTMRFRK
jgi:hypothetical protein